MAASQAGAGVLPPPEEKQPAVRAMFDRIAGRYDLCNALMTFGLDRLWRTRTVRSLLLAPGASVADVGAGTAGLSLVAAELGLVPVALDLSYEMLATAPAALGAKVQADVAALPLKSASFDGVVSGFALRNFSDLGRAFAEMARVVRPGGRIGLLEVCPPGRGLFGLGHRWWLEKVVPRIGALLSDKAAYAYLPASLSYLPAPAALAAQLNDAGFFDVRRRVLHGVAQLFTATRAGTIHLADLEEVRAGEH